MAVMLTYGEKSKVEFREVDQTTTSQFTISEESTLLLGKSQLNGSMIAEKKSTVISNGPLQVGGTMQLCQSTLQTDESISIAETGSLQGTDDLVFHTGMICNKGIFSVENASAFVEKYQSTESSTTTIKNSQMDSKAKFYSKTTADFQGSTVFEKSDICAEKKVTLSAGTQVSITDTSINSAFIDFGAEGDIHGENIFAATQYLKQSDTALLSGDGIMHYQAPQGSLKGHFIAHGATVDIQKLEEGLKDLLSGMRVYQHFAPTEYLDINASEAVIIDQSIDRSCSLGLVAPTIEVRKFVETKKGLHFTTTEGDLVFIAKAHSDGDVVLHSAHDIKMDQTSVVSDQVLVLSTENGNLYNVASEIGGEKYLEGLINGNIYNTSVAKQTSGEYGPVVTYDLARIIGGRDEDGVGMFLETTGEIVNDAGDISSQGANIIHANKGYQGISHANTYVAERIKKNGWWSGNEREIIATNVFSPTLFSAEGKNIIVVKEAGVAADAASFISKEGTDIFARDKIYLRGKKATQEIHDKGYSWFGLLGHKHKESHESIVPTVIYDVGKSNIRSFEGDIDAQDTQILGPGSTTLQAKNVRFSTNIENHYVTTQTRTISFDMFGLKAICSILGGAPVISSLTQEDPTLTKLNKFVSHSSNLPEFLAHGSNLGLNVYNTYQQFSDAFHHDGVRAALLQRYGLGDHTGFNPTISVTPTVRQANKSYQARGSGKIDRDHVAILAEDTAAFEGIPVSVKSMQIKARYLTQNGIKLESDATTHAMHVSLSVTPKLEIVSAGLGYEQQYTHDSKYQVQRMNVAENLHLELDSWMMDGAIVDATTVSGNVKDMQVVTYSDTHHAHNYSGNVSTTWFVSGSYSAEDATTVNEKSGLRVHASGAKQLTIETAHLTGGSFETTDSDNINIGSINVKELQERKNGWHLGLSGNIHDFIPRSASKTSSCYQSAMIPIMSLQLGRTSYCASNPTSTSIQGKIDTDSIQAKTIGCDQHIDIELDVPLSIPRRKVFVPQPVLLLELEESFLEGLTIDCKEINSMTTPVLSAIEDSFLEKMDISLPNQSNDGLLLSLKNDEDSPDMDFRDVGTIRLGRKRGGGGKKQLFDIDSGSYTSLKRSGEKILKENKVGRTLAAFNKVGTEVVFFENNNKQTYWCSPYGYEQDGIILRPNIASNYGYIGKFAAEYNPNDILFNLEAAIGGKLRFQLAHGKCQPYNIGALSFALDLASAAADAQCIVDTSRGFNAKMNAEIGALGPTINITANLPEISLLGLTFQNESSLKAGIGAKAIVGAGITFDKTQYKLRLYVEAGAYVGLGGKFENALSVGIDWQATKRAVESYHSFVGNKEYREAVKLYDNMIASNEQWETTGILDTACKYIRSILLYDVRQEVQSMPVRAAIFSGLFSVRNSPRQDVMNKNQCVAEAKNSTAQRNAT